MTLHKLSAAEQTAAHLKDWLINKNASDKIPGVDRLSEELGVSRDTVRRALIILEKAGFIRSGGRGKRRVLIKDFAASRIIPTGPRALRVLIFPDMKMEDFSSYLMAHALQLQGQIREAGCNCQFTDRTLADFDEQLERIERYVAANEADVWIVKSATTTVLEWFEKQPFVSIAWGGRPEQLKLASSGSNLVPAIREATRHLVSLGHRRIAYLTPPVSRKPSISRSGQAFLEVLNSSGVTTSEAYHLPEFHSSPHGIEDALKQMFRVTPPTALIVGMHAYHLCLLGFLRQNNLRVPEDVSVIAGYTDPKLEWMVPRQAHFLIQMDRIIRKIVKWVEDAARGKRPDGQMTYEAVYSYGASVGPVSR